MNDFDRNENNKVVYSLLSDLCSYSIENGGEACGDLFAWLSDRNHNNDSAIDSWLRLYYYDTEDADNALDEMSDLCPYENIREVRYSLSCYGDRLYRITDIEDFIVRPLRVEDVMNDLKLKLR